MSKDKDKTRAISDLFKAAVACRMEENKKRSLIDLQELLTITKFTKQEIKMMYRGFKQVIPSLLVKCQTFNELLRLNLDAHVIRNVQMAVSMKILSRRFTRISFHTEVSLLRLNCMNFSRLQRRNILIMQSLLFP